MEAPSLNRLAPLEASLDVDFKVLLRPIGRHDVDRVEGGLLHLSGESFFNRFLRHTSARELAEYLCQSRNELTWVALNPDDSDFPGYGGASLWRDAQIDDLAEMSITVVDAWQRRGLACLLFSILWIEGWRRGLRRITGLCRGSNVAILNWWSGLGGSVALEGGYGQLSYTLVTPEKFIDLIGYDLHASAIQVEIASWLQHWREVLENPSTLKP